MSNFNRIDKTRTVLTAGFGEKPDIHPIQLSRVDRNGSAPKGFTILNVFSVTPRRSTPQNGKERAHSSPRFWILERNHCVHTCRKSTEAVATSRQSPESSSSSSFGSLTTVNTNLLGRDARRGQEVSNRRATPTPVTRVHEGVRRLYFCSKIIETNNISPTTLTSTPPPPPHTHTHTIPAPLPLEPVDTRSTLIGDMGINVSNRTNERKRPGSGPVAEERTNQSTFRQVLCKTVSMTSPRPSYQHKRRRHHYVATPPSGISSLTTPARQPFPATSPLPPPKPSNSVVYSLQSTDTTLPGLPLQDSPASWTSQYLTCYQKPACAWGSSVSLRYFHCPRGKLGQCKQRKARKSRESQ